MTKPHTPGPWEVTFHGRSAYVSMFCGKAGLPASATGRAEFSVQPYNDPQEAAANARLIAAAPELLETLRDVEANLTGQDHFPERVADSLRRVKDAIAKAEGR